MKKNKTIAAAVISTFLWTAVTVTGPAAHAALTDAQRLVPLGIAAGISLETEGVLVVGLSGVSEGEETRYPARDAGVREGDMILAVGDREVRTAEELQSALEQADAPTELTLRRNGSSLTLPVDPVRDGEGGARIGVWIRDSILGIGTLTFYDPETGSYGALGHGISGKNTGHPLAVGGGDLLHGSIGGVRRGSAGKPGELLGSYEPDRRIGSITANTEAGIFGTLEQVPEGHVLPVADEDAVHLGAAEILTCVEGDEPQRYGIRICALYHGAEAEHRSLLIEVTDRTLLEKTGGIVQGMSGSPILQDGRIVGAVTHVLVNNPAKGYGIRIGSMLRAADAAAEEAA